MQKWYLECPCCDRQVHDTGTKIRNSIMGYFCKDCLHASREYIKMNEHDVIEFTPVPVVNDNMAGRVV